MKSTRRILLLPLLVLSATCQLAWGQIDTQDTLVVQAADIDIYFERGGSEQSFIISHTDSLFDKRQSYRIRILSHHQSLKILSSNVLAANALEVNIRLSEQVKALGRINYEILKADGSELATGKLVLHGPAPVIESVTVHAFGEERENVIPLIKSRSTYVQMIIEGQNIFRNSTITFEDSEIEIDGSQRVLFGEKSKQPPLQEGKGSLARIYAPIKIKALDEKQQKAFVGPRIMNIGHEYTPSSSEIFHVVIDSIPPPLILQDSSFLHVAAIKSVSGHKPVAEFFDLLFRFRITDIISTLANLDIALSSDTLTPNGQDNSNQYRITEAGLLLNLEWSKCLKSWKNTKENRRLQYIGVLIKIFNGIPYAGAAIGGIELRTSPLQTSYFYLAYLTSIYKGSNTPSYNLYAEVRIHSDKSNFFKTFAIKGGFLFPRPFGKKSSHQDVQTRIVLEIPIGHVINF